MPQSLRQIRLAMAGLMLPLPTLLVLLLCFGSGGCSVLMAATQPEKKDLKLFNPGTARGLVLAEFGSPIASELRNGLRVEVYSFTQGYDKLNKGIRVAGHATADFFTVGLWEIAGTPTEMIFSGERMVYQVQFDRDDRVASALKLDQRAAAFKPPPPSAVAGK